MAFHHAFCTMLQCIMTQITRKVDAMKQTKGMKCACYPTKNRLSISIWCSQKVLKTATQSLQNHHLPRL
ncbi:hypothetical protein HMPREF0971_00256 [Segatella oris F0302]|uniref:Uncharacterized protein n=1 Tax=Segatella oris F0302 TaxID=649760 RepID=D1QMW7_9BACT|nr:hypothetical protein HMPREF0971_00256 [Segatella oris F0302]